MPSPRGRYPAAVAAAIEYTFPMGKRRAGHQDGPRLPSEALDTIRRSIMAELGEGPLPAREISGRVGIPEKEVAGHLEHILASLKGSGRPLEIHPAVCVQCGFVFAKRTRLTRPGKCPVCKSGSIQAPLFSLSARDRT